MSNAESTFIKPLETAARHALTYLSQLDSSPVGAGVSAELLRERLDRQLSPNGISPERVVEELAADVSGGLHGTGNGRFFGWVIGGTLPAALGADWLTSTWHQNGHNYATGPAVAIVEEIVGRWLKAILGLPFEASFALVTGSQMAHVTCLGAARHSLLARREWDVEKHGLSGAPKIRVVSSEHAHGSIERALRLLGFGTSCWIKLPAAADGRLDPAVLESELSKDSRAPTVVVLQAGDLNIGAFDPFETLIPLAKRYGAWVHVDGAFGLWAAASPHLRHWLSGVQAADSWVTDGHKSLNVPYDCGYAFVADREAHAATMSHRASYISYSGAARDASDWTPEWSRRARGFSTYAAIRQLGTEGIAKMIERCCVHAHSIVVGIGRLPGAEIVWEPRINQGLVRFLDSRASASPYDHDRRTDDIIAKINAGGGAFFSGTTWRGRRAMRISVCNWQTSQDDVARAIDAVAEALRYE